MVLDTSPDDDEDAAERQHSLFKQQFARLYAFGTPIPKALVEAGFASRSMGLGLQLLSDPEVQAIIDQTREWIVGKLADNKQTLINQLHRDREFAYQMENPSAAVSATMAVAKLMGMLDPDASAKVPKKIVIEWSDDVPSHVPEAG